MDLIDRYLVAVRRHLPRPLQTDIVEELSDSLRSEAEETEQRLGRALTADDQSALLKRHGHPWLTASGYMPQQYLVGPALFPYYRQALMIVLFWVVLPMALASAVITAIYSPDSSRVWAKALGAAWTGGVFSIGIVTAVFGVLEAQRVRITALDNWEPANLPEPRAGHAAARGESLASLIFSLAFLLMWTGLLPLPESARRFVPEPIWNTVYLPILIVLASIVVTSFIDLIRPWRTPSFSALRIAINVGAATIAGIVLRAGHWVQVTAGVDGRSAQVDYWVNHGIQWSLFVVIAICLFDSLVEIWSTVKGRRETLI